MSIAGAYRLGPESGRLLVHTTRTGLGARAGHDLTIEVTRWHGQARVDTAVPANSSVTIQVDVGSFQVRQGTGGVKPLTDADRAEISKTLKQVLTLPSIQPSPSGPGGSTGRRGRSPSTVS